MGFVSPGKLKKDVYASSRGVFFAEKWGQIRYICKLA